MAKSHQPFNRREFLGRLSAGAAGASVGLALARQGAAAPAGAAKLEKRNEQSGMIYRPLGKANLNVSCLSFGCLPLSDDSIPVLEMLVERGLNLVHVSESYGRGRAIAALGKYLQKAGNRDKVWIALKGDRGLVEEDVNRQLGILNTDHVDIVCSPLSEPDKIRGSEREKEVFEKLKQAGKTRFHNLTTHTSPEASMAAGLDAGWYDNILSVVDLNNVKRFQPVLERANKMYVGVLAMKTMRGGGRRGRGRRRGGPGDDAGGAERPTPEKIAPVILGAGVTSILKGISSRADAEAWLAAVAKADTASAEIPAEYAVAAPGVCTLCGECTGCPNGVAIQDVVRDYTYYYEQQGLPETAAERYGELRLCETVLSCGDCGRCEERCPMSVPVRRILRDAHARLGSIA
jgi:predicted aldo/keto reductase-like oxidoreductase